MTDEEIVFLQQKKFEIENASDFVEELETTTDEFGERILTRTISSVSVEYKVVQHYLYLKAYNNEGIFGGYALQDIIEEVMQLGGVE